MTKEDSTKYVVFSELSPLDAPITLLNAQIGVGDNEKNCYFRLFNVHSSFIHPLSTKCKSLFHLVTLASRSHDYLEFLLIQSMKNATRV